jgi:transcription initiation factor TFIIH subunit 1
MHRAYDEWVPDRLTEKQFWTKYFQSQYFHRDRIKSKKEVAEDTSGVHADDIFSTYSHEDEIVEG